MKSTNLTNYREGLRDGIPIALGYLAVSFTLGIAARNLHIRCASGHDHESGQFHLGRGICRTRYHQRRRTLPGNDHLPGHHQPALSADVLRTVPEACSGCFAVSPVLDRIFHHGRDLRCLLRPSGTSEPVLHLRYCSIAIPGWALGTCLGVILGTALPDRITRALSVALYGMFLAVIIPPARKDRIIAGLVVISMLASYLFTMIPALSGISSGMRVIILTVLISGAAAFLFPIKEDPNNAE